MYWHPTSRTREQSDQALFDGIAECYARKDSVASSSLARRNQLFLAIKPVLDERASLGTVVEIGCGVGAPARYLAGHYDHYIGIDHSAEMIRAAQIFHLGNSKAEFLASNARAIDLPANTADTVLSVGALHHMVELDDVMDSLVKAAKPRAFLAAIEPQNGNPALQIMRWVRGRADPSYSCEQIYFSEQELRDLLGRHGLTVLAAQYQGFVSPPFGQVIMNPQVVFAPLSRAASRVDSWLAAHLPLRLRKLSFNLALIGRFAK